MNTQISDVYRYCAVAAYAERHRQPAAQPLQRQANASCAADSESRTQIARRAEQRKQR